MTDANTHQAGLGGHAALGFFLRIGLAALVALSVLFVSPALGNYTQTAGWDTTGDSNAGVQGLAFDPASGAVFTIAPGHPGGLNGSVTRWNLHATGSGDFSAFATGTGEHVFGSNVLTGVTADTGVFSVGESLSGHNIRPGTTITAIDGNVITLSAAAGNQSTPTDPILSGSKAVAGLETSWGSFGAGDLLFAQPPPSWPANQLTEDAYGGVVNLYPDSGLHLNTTITAAGPNSLTLSDGPTLAKSGALLTALTTSSFGDSLTSSSRYSGVAVDPANHDVYALADATTSPVIGVFHPDGSSAGIAPFAVATGGAQVGIDVDAAGNVYVPAPSAGVVREYDTSGAVVQTFDPSTSGHGTLHDPRDVAVDSNGNVYVADSSTNEVNEVQRVDLHGATDGTYKLGFDGATTGATGTGDIAGGTGTGNMVTAAGKGNLSLLGQGTGDLTRGSKTIGALSVSSGSFSVGESISSGGSAGSIPAGATITACSPNCTSPTSLTVSKPVTADESAAALTSGSKTIGGLSVTSGHFAVGMTLTGSGIPSYGDHGGRPTTITACAPNCTSPSALTLSTGVIAAGAAVTLKAGYVTNLNITSGSFEVGQELRGDFFGYLDRTFNGPIVITGVNGGTLQVSRPPTSTLNGSHLVSGTQTIKNLTTTSGEFTVGLWLSGAGLPPRNTFFTSPGYVPLIDKTQPDSQPDSLTFRDEADVTTQPGTGVALSANLDAASTHSGGIGTASTEGSLEQLPTIGDATAGTGFTGSYSSTENVGVGNISGEAFNVTFEKALGGRNLAQMSCTDVNLSGGSGGCEVTTSTEGSAIPGRVVKFDPASNFVSDFIAPGGTYTADAVAVDRSNDDVYVAGGNSHWAPIGGQTTLSGPDFAVRRYDSSGTQLDTIGLGTLADAIHSPTYSKTVGFGLDVDSVTHKVYTIDSVGLARVYSSAHTLTVTPAGSGSGSVSAGAGAISNCSSGGGTCSDSYAEGDTVTLTASPDPHNQVAWSGCSSTNGTTCTVTMGATDAGVTATFTHIQHTLTVTPAGSGSGSVSAGAGAISNCSSGGGTCSGPYDEASTIVLTASPTANTGVSWSGCDSVGGSSPNPTCTVQIDADTGVTATFTSGQHNLFASTGGSGSGSIAADSGPLDCGSVCAGGYADDATVTLTANPAGGSLLSGWSVSGDPSSTCTGTTSPCTVTMSADVTVSADFGLTHTLTVHQTGNGGGTVTCKVGAGSFGACVGSYGDDAQLTVHVAPDSNSSFDGFDGSTGSASSCAGTADCTFAVGADTQVEVPLSLAPRTLTLNTAGGAGAGTISCDLGSGDGPCASSYDSGTQLTVTAHAGPHSSFGGDVFAGSGDSASACAASPCTFTITADTTVKASFAQIHHSLTVGTNGSGTVSCDGAACAASYVDGTVLTLVASPASGWRFHGWSGDCSGGGGCALTINADTAVTASFSEIPAPSPAPTPTPAPNPKSAYGQCVKSANKAFHKLLAKAKRKHGKARAMAIKAAGKKRGKLINRCKEG